MRIVKTEGKEMQGGPVIVYGSLAYDWIMDFPGKFSDHILPDKIHVLSVSFLMKKLSKSYGGTAGNVAYTLSLFKVPSMICSNAGGDFSSYDTRLSEHNINTSLVRIIQHESTASAYIMTDKHDSQITAFHPGAMQFSCPLPDTTLLKKSFITLIGPGNIIDMVRLAKRVKKVRRPYIFDPGQQASALPKKSLLALLTGSFITIVNDYELSLIEKKIGRDQNAILRLTKNLIVTLGPEGSIVYSGKIIRKIQPAQSKKIIDPTGAGDAYRAGLIAGLYEGRPMEEAARLGSLAALYAIEKKGTQNHFFTRFTFEKRMRLIFAAKSL